MSAATTEPQPAAPRLGDWIQTFTGRKFYPLDARPEDVDVRDIAHALANICRFTGHSKTFYSVAQHSVLASRAVPEFAALPALLHDAAEAYMGDIARPWKRYLFVVFPGEMSARLRDIEHRLLDTILAALDCPLDPLAWKEVERVDTLMLVTEGRDLMGPLHADWHHRPEHGFDVLPEPVSPWTPGRSEQEFLRRFAELTRGRS